jgi:hypothetical protein
MSASATTASSNSGRSPPAARFIDEEIEIATRETGRSFLRHSGFAKPGEISGIEIDIRRPVISASLSEGL